MRKKIETVVHSHPDHSNQRVRLSRIKGQVEGIERMIDEGRYCIDIINQVRSVQSALRGLEGHIMEGHLRACVKEAFESRDSFSVDQKIREIIGLRLGP